ncbi:hypothetical protein [Bdellovibrio sp. HCB209]|uniref:hypothetical protein n=1 Tax=Bdellovibrio sp. HCB209 TaxID=3394354 RepID=UPI0039B3B9A4
MEQESFKAAKTKVKLFDWGFVALTCLAYQSIPRGIDQSQLTKLYQVSKTHPELAEVLAPVKQSLLQLRHQNILPYIAIAAISLWFAYSKPTPKAVRATLIVLAIFAVPLNYYSQMMS